MRTHIAKLTDSFRNFAKAPKMTHELKQSVASDSYAMYDFHTTWCAFHGAVEWGRGNVCQCSAVPC